ncbi:MAG: alcohol dehydrogenase catalytic domain-containing protein [Patescibacteria group bacterium]
MKAAIIQSPQILHIQEVSEPVMGEYDALCELLCASICNGTDHHAIKGDPYFEVPFPTILGHEGIGRVLAVGTHVRQFKVGDLVTRVVNTLPSESNIRVKPGWGSFAERGIVTDWQALRDHGVPESTWRPHMIHQVLPPDIDPLAATMVITWRETLSFLRRMGVHAGERILIIGSGANALAFVEHARNLGLVPSVIGSPQRASSFQQAGATHFISYRDTDALASLHTHERFDVMIDAIGKSDGLNAILPRLKPHGKVAVYGLDHFLAYDLHATKAPGAFMYFNGNEYEEGTTHEEVVEALRAGKLDPWLYLSKEHTYPFHELHKALDASEQRLVIKSAIDFRLS